MMRAPFPLCLLALSLAATRLPAQSTPQARTPRPVIAIDPGHPSEVSRGDEPTNGVTEVHAAWTVARSLAALLRRRGYDVVMTKRREGQMVTNVARAGVANDAHALLLVRLHCDTSPDSGFAVYFPDRTGTADGRTGPSAAVMRASRAAAESVHVSLARALSGRLADGGVRGDSRTLVGSRQGALTGSIFSEVPVVLVEMATLTNARDARFIASAAGRGAMARALAAGVERYAPLAGLPRPRR